MDYSLVNIISIQSGFKAAISILDDLSDERKIAGYIPTENGVKFLEEVFRALDTSKSSRPVILTGTYGTGKSHLGLITAAMLSGDTRNNAFNTIIPKIDSKWKDKASLIRRIREKHGEKPLLLVYLEAEEIDFGTGFINNSLLVALKRALNKNSLSNLTPETAYDSAVKRINEIKEVYPATYGDLERKVVEKGYFSVDNFIKRLKEKHDKKALDDFCQLHKDICSGATFDIFSKSSPIDAYKSTIEAIKKEGYGGILLIWDEFTPVMRKLASDPDGAEAIDFQKFAQMCEGSGVNKVILITISHRTIEETIDIVSKESFKADIAKAAEKISGRFKSISLGHIDKEAYYLMSGIILHDSKFEEVKHHFNERFLDIKENIKTTNMFYGLNDSDLNTLVYNLFPLHPTATFILSHLSDRIGQRNRSIFTYLCDTGETTFSSFLTKNTITSKKLPFILPRDILGYFLDLMKITQDDKNIRKITRAFLDRQPSIDPNDQLAIDILKTILLFNATNAVSATDNNIMFAHAAFTNQAKQEIANKLQQLRDKKILKKRISDDGWCFYGIGTDTSIDDHLLEIVKESEKNWTLKTLFSNALENINIKTYLKSIEADDYNTERDIKRKIDLYFILPQELNNPNYLASMINFLDGKYFLVLTTSEAENSFSVQKITSDFREFKNMLFAIPAEYSIFNELQLHLKRLKAFDALPEKNPIYKNELHEELLTEKSDTETFLKEKLEYILDPRNGILQFYYNGNREEIAAINQLKKLVSKMMYETFPYTPAIASDVLIDDDRPDTLRKYKIPLIDTVLSPNAPKILINDKDTWNLIEIFYKRHGILRMEKGETLISKPRKDNGMAKIWDKIVDFIDKSQISPAELIKLIDDLRLPPYGLKKKIIGPILTVVMRQYILDNQLIFYWKGSPVDKITGEIIEEKIINKRQEIKILFQEITEKHKLILKGIKSVFEIENEDMDSIYREVVNWWRGLPQYSRNTTKITKEIKEIRDNFFVPLSSEEKDRKELFNTILPDLLGLKDLSSVPANEIEDIVHNKMLGVKSVFVGIIEELKKEIESAGKECLGTVEKITSDYENLSNTVKNSTITGDAGELLKWFNESINNNKFDFTVLAERILGRIDNWNDEYVIKLKGHIESAINAIRSFQPTVGTESGVKPRPDIQEVLFNIKQDKRFHRYFKYYEDLEDAPNKTQALIIYDVIKSAIVKNLQSGQITGDEVMSIICRIILEAFEDA